MRQILQEIYQKNIVPIYEAKQNQLKHLRKKAKRDEQLDVLINQWANIKNETEEDRTKIAEIKKKISKERVEKKVRKIR
jgi:hypothetical protein